MITQSDLEHHLKRERQERLLVETTTDPAARHAHLELAESHKRRAAQARILLERQANEHAKASGQTATGDGRQHSAA